MFIGFSYSYAVDNLSVCKSWSESAGYIMKARQENLPMYESLELVKDIYGDDEILLRLVNKMVLMAYETPQFIMEENKTKSTIDFENKIMLSCMKGKM